MLHAQAEGTTFMVTLYEITDAKSYHIPVGQGHQLHVEEYGNPQGVPVLVCHGGPGAGANVLDCRYFNPQKYRIILFSQRGCGLSTPQLHTEFNQTSYLLNDIEIIRKTLGIKAWLLSGCSWGATLALLYAIATPEKVLGLLLRGTFLARKQDLQWLYGRQGGAMLFPDYYQHFNPSHLSYLDLMDAYATDFNSDNELQKLKSAKAWCEWELVLSGLHPTHNSQYFICDTQRALNVAILEHHYFLNNCFIEDNYILNQVGAIAHLPIHFIHGRHDFVAPLAGVYELAQALNARLDILNDVGHSSENHSYAEAMRSAADLLYCKAKSSYLKILG
ncbi:prolyl aminopeptidase [Pseudoalteromonas tunicata]|uniref:Proline iminopeptidase n=2 Tax=Pseudoalteromonas tunicata TaxID=314281 RepID=A4C7U3_9GAMM|nr:prolyl aminopeptidase [Pseudoalteromonas tunicata]AXT32233.1 prolyl aminopeptidase [Pseudoalteromonas tunicata]EAR28658.1 Peptidase S33, proline iminopeptidase 1 [Pseudoalteromonas tunicata D2]